MARINTNIASLISRSNLAKTSDDLTVRLQRLSTGLRINRGADDPAGLIVSERLRSELKGLTQAIENSQRASSVIATTEGYLAEVADLLNSIKALIVQRVESGVISRKAMEKGMETLRDDGAHKVLEGITTIAEVLRSTQLAMVSAEGTHAS